MTETAKFT